MILWVEGIDAFSGPDIFGGEELADLSLAASWCSTWYIRLLFPSTSLVRVSVGGIRLCRYRCGLVIPE